MFDRIRDLHGEGGKEAKHLVEEHFISRFRSVPLQRQLDAAVVGAPDDGKLAISTQTCVVQPIFFPGGDIGRLAIFRAVNNIAVMGASPRYVTVSFLLEEGVN